MGEDREGMAAWQRVVLILGLAVVLVVVVLLAGGDHGPSRHTRGADAETTTDAAEELHDVSRWNH
jgi:hypothetical protein